MEKGENEFGKTLVLPTRQMADKEKPQKTKLRGDKSQKKKREKRQGSKCKERAGR